MPTRTRRISATSLLWCGALALAPGVFAQAGALSDVNLDGVEVPDDLPAEDWAGIRTAYEAGRHAAYSVEGGYQARNPGQRWRTKFDGLGFTTLPDAGGWTWGLQLESYGFPGNEQKMTKPASVSAEGGRVAYGWDSTLEEWYVNDTRGLEHGFTVHQRPARRALSKEAPLAFTLAVRGQLHPEVTADGRGVHFLDDESTAALTYTGLRVFDADGQELDAHFRRDGDRLCLLVSECGARYPLTIDPIAQQAYLKASNTDGNDHFGYSVAVSGNTVVVGAYGEGSNATGANGNQSDNSLRDAGAAYVFVRSGTNWIQQAYLKASNTDADDKFGWSVAVSRDTVVVGAAAEASIATGVNGDQSDNRMWGAGAVYVFVRSSTNWSQQAYLKASNTDTGDSFGVSVAVSGDTVVVGACYENSNATGVNGNQADESAPQAGAAYVFVRGGTSWSQQSYLKASNTDRGDYFGFSLALTENTVVVGAPWEDSNATGVNGNQNDDSAFGAGAAYVFLRSGTSWSQQAYLKASNADVLDVFGWSSTASGDTVVIGAPEEGSSATGVNGNESDNSALSAGAAYVFVRNGTTWSQQAYLKASNTDAYDWFGWSVAVSGNTVVAGAYEEDSNATGVNGNQGDNTAADAGAAYVFAGSGTNWSQLAYLKASNPGAGDVFGTSVAVFGDTVVIGAPEEASNATGVNGDQSDNSASTSGAAYVIDLDLLPNPTCQWYCGTGTNAATDGYVITSPAGLGETFEASVTGCDPGNAGAFLVAYSTPLAAASPWGEILVNIADPNGELLGMPSALGNPTAITLPVPNDPQLSGLVFYTQAVSFGGSICLHCAHECSVGY